MSLYVNVCKPRRGIDSSLNICLSKTEKTRLVVVFTSLLSTIHFCYSIAATLRHEIMQMKSRAGSLNTQSMLRVISITWVFDWKRDYIGLLSPRIIHEHEFYSVRWVG